MQYPLGHWRLVGFCALLFMANLVVHRPGPTSARGGPDELHHMTFNGNDRPVCYIYQQPAPPGSTPEPSGLLFAAWKDGVVLVARGLQSPGKHLQVGRLQQPVNEFLKQLLVHDGVADLRTHAYTVPSGRFVVLSVQDGHGAHYKLAWDEVIIPGYGHNAKPDDEYRKFVKAWYMAKISVVSAQIMERRDLADTDMTNGVFRGYRIDKPGLTPWLIE